MKKLLLIASFLLSFAGLGIAQTTPAVKKDKAVKAAPARTATATPAATAAPAKKDGTPDMRYKANKDAKAAAPATTHVKKDGTPDKRFKENKDANKRQ